MGSRLRTHAAAGKGSTAGGGPQSAELGGKALDGGVWAGLRPSMVRGSLAVLCVEVRPWVEVPGWGLGSALPEGPQ